MFDDYKKKLEEIEANVPKVFNKVAKMGAVKFRNEAVKITDQEGLVDIGNYRRNWNAEVIELNEGEYGIVCMNSMEYASFLEDGYEIHRSHFVPFDVMQGTPKTQRLISSFKAKYPDAKGFIAKPRRFKGLKIGRRAIDETRYYCFTKLDDIFVKLYTEYKPKPQ